MLFLIAAFLAACAIYANTPLPRETPLDERVTHQFQASNVCGDRLCNLNTLWPEDIDVDKLPRHVVDAFVSAEDRRFWERDGGFDLSSTLRGCVTNACRGGSTIEMQLAKLRYTGRHNRRADGVDFLAIPLKLHETFIAAFQLGRDLEKKQILGRYLASAHFGKDITGLDEAARYYFNKSPANLTIAEAAHLAGSLPKPSARNIQNANKAEGRRAARRVLDRMREDGRITPAQWRHAIDHPARFSGRGRPAAELRPYLISDLERAARDRPPGAVVATTIDNEMQRAAENAVAEYARDARRRRANCVALVAVRPNGAMLAMVGGFDFNANQNNCARADRQPGSAFKLITLAAAVRAGVRADEWIEDSAICMATGAKPWCPTNNGNRYLGWISVREAIAHSANNAALRLGLRAGLQSVISTARAAGLPGNFSMARPSFLLGAVTATPLDMARALARVTGCASAEIHFFPEDAPGPCAPMLNAAELSEFNAVAAAPIREGTGRRAHFAGDGNCIGKTGTSNSRYDAWFVGRCGDVIAVVWLGRLRLESVNMAGGDTPALIWRAFMQHVARMQIARQAARPA